MITLKNIVDEFQSFADNHYFLKSFSYGTPASVDLDKFTDYPLLHLVYNGSGYDDNEKTYSFDLYILDAPPIGVDPDGKDAYEKQALTSAEQVSEDILADLENGGKIFQFAYGYEIVSSSTVPLMEQTSNVLTGVLFSLSIATPYLYDSCNAPLIGIAPGGSLPPASGGGGAGTLRLREVDGVPNVMPVGTIIVSDNTLTDNGDGTVTLNTDTALGNYLPLTGGTLTGNLLMDNSKISIDIDSPGFAFEWKESDGTKLAGQLRAYANRGDIYLFAEGVKKAEITAMNGSFIPDLHIGGTTNSSKALEVTGDVLVNGTIDATGNIEVTGNTVGFIINEADAGNQRWQMFGEAGKFAIRDITGNKYPFRIEPNAKTNSLYIHDDGFIGIGTSSPNVLLDVEGADPHLRINNTTQDSSTILSIRSPGTTGNGQIRFGDTADSNVGLILYAHNDDSFRFHTNDSEKVRITSTGNFGIGTSPTEKLDVSGNIKASGTLSLGGELDMNSNKITNVVAGTNNLDAVNYQQLINTATGGLTYLGTWDANLNDPTLASGVGISGGYYIVSTTGSTDLDGITDWVVGDWALFASTSVWQKVDNTSVLDGIGTGGTIAKWTGSGTSATLGDSLITEVNGVNDVVKILANLEIVNGSATELRFTGSNTSNISSDGTIYLQAAGSLRLGSGGVNDKVVLSADGKVGIGTTTPAQKLVVEGGNIWIKPTVDGEESKLYLSSNSSSGDPLIYISAEDVVGDNINFVIGRYSQLFNFIGSGATYGLQTRFVVKGFDSGGTEYSQISLYAPNSAESFRIKTDGDSWINNSGNVGIGTTSPDVKLRVEGTSSTMGVLARMYGDGTYGAAIRYDRGTSYSWVAGIGGSGSTSGIPTSYFGFSELGTTPRLVIAHTTGNVGIGTASPGVKLDVDGQIRTDDSFLLQSGTTAIGSIRNQSGALDIRGDSTRDVSLGSVSNPQSLFVEGANGNVGIGHINPTSRLYVQGAVDGVTTTLSVIDVTASLTYKKFIVGRSEAEGLYIGNDDAASIIASFQDEDAAGYGNLILQADDEGSKDGYLDFRGKTGGSRMRLLADGNVGIGIASPAYGIDVNHPTARIGGADHTSASLLIEATNLEGTPAIAARILMHGYEGRAKGVFYTDVSYGGEFFSGVPYSASHNFWTVGFDETGGQAEYLENAKLTVRNNGMVGIGTTNPLSTLDIVGSALANLFRVANTDVDATTKYGSFMGRHYTNSEENITGMLLTSSSSATGGAVSIGGGITSANAVNYIKFYTATDNTTLLGSERMRITSIGRVGIGTPSPDELLSVQDGFVLASGSSTGHGFKLKRDNLDTYSIRHLDGGFTIYNDTDSRKEMSFDGAGKVGIGTDAPTEKLEVDGNIKATGTISSDAGSTGLVSTIQFDSTKSMLYYPGTGNINFGSLIQGTLSTTANTQAGFSMGFVSSSNNYSFAMLPITTSSTIEVEFKYTITLASNGFVAFTKTGAGQLGDPTMTFPTHTTIGTSTHTVTSNVSATTQWGLTNTITFGYVAANTNFTVQPHYLKTTVTHA